MATDHRGNPLHAGKRTNDEMHANLSKIYAEQDAEDEKSGSMLPESDPEYDPADYGHGISFPNN